MYDCIIIGAGISGCSLAFELSKYSGKVLWLEKNNDVADETTKANSAIIHAGYDPEPNTLMAKYNIWGNKIIPSLCKDLDVPCKNIGSLVDLVKRMTRLLKCYISVVWKMVLKISALLNSLNYQKWNQI